MSPCRRSRRSSAAGRRAGARAGPWRACGALTAPPAAAAQAPAPAPPPTPPPPTPPRAGRQAARSFGASACGPREAPGGSSTSGLAPVGVDDLPPRALRSQEELAKLADRAVPAPGARHEVRDRLHRRRRVGDGDREPGDLQRRDIEEVVTDEGDRVGGDVVLGAQRFDGLALPTGPEDDRVDAELAAPCLRDRARLARDHRRPEPRALGQGDGDSVVRVERLELVAALGEDHPPVREHAVDVHHEEPDLPRSRDDGARRHHATRRDRRTPVAGAAIASAWASPGSATTMAAKNQNGSMMRTMMNVLAPIAWPRRPTVPATNPSASPRSSGVRSAQNESTPAFSTAHTSTTNAVKPTTPVSTSVRANCWSMNANPVTP